MSDIQIAAILLSLTAGIAYVNARWIRLPAQIGMLAIALLGSLAIVALDALGAIDASRVRSVVGEVDLGPTLVHGMLGLLLFAGALHVPLDALAAQRWPVAMLSLCGTLGSTALVAAAMWVVIAVLGIDMGWREALLFGALISPTDPVAVLGLLARSKVPRELAVQISGESLFNDGIGVVVFTVILDATSGGSPSAGHVALLFVRDAVGGAVFGLGLGYLLLRMLRGIDEGTVAVIVTFGLVFGGYAAAEALEVSAPIAAVVAGLVVGNRASGAGDAIRVPLEQFWALVDELLNAVLFLALGLEATRLHVEWSLAVAAAAAVPIALAARLASVAVSLAALRPFKRSDASAHAIAILTWGGLRGGLAVALALALPADAARDGILVMTYAVVAFAVLVQGMTLGALLRRFDLAA